MISVEERKLGRLTFTKLQLNDTAHGNALGLKSAQALITQIQDLKTDGLLVSNQGRRFFCTGGNIKEQALATRDDSLKTQKLIREALGQIAELSIPTLALVKGDAFGGGLELLSAFDYVIATPHVQLGLWQRRLGVTFGWGGGERLLKRLSAKQLSQNFIAAKVFSAFEAEGIGLVDEVLPFGLAEIRAWQWLVKSAKLPKASLTSFRDWTPESEIEIFEELWFNKDHLKAIKK